MNDTITVAELRDKLLPVMSMPDDALVSAETIRKVLAGEPFLCENPGGSTE